MSETTEAPKQELPVNHPGAGYLAPDQSLNDGNEILPEELQAELDETAAAREAEAAAIAEREDAIAKLEEDPPHPEETAKSKSKSSEKVSASD
jgi:hypothetical protein